MNFQWNISLVIKYLKNRGVGKIQINFDKMTNMLNIDLQILKERLILQQCFHSFSF